MTLREWIISSRRFERMWCPTFKDLRLRKKVYVWNKVEVKSEVKLIVEPGLKLLIHSVKLNVAYTKYLGSWN